MISTSITKREKEILDLLSTGFTTKEIAKNLYLSNHTVITHRKNLLNKMDARNVASMIRRGFEEGLLSVAS